ncbi:MAG TPA: family 1 encapsulin nanocompartment shell protein [Acidimicrobiales bacterium]|nr:family 1 encapsulin nanocompartment shell protein [Acidimicrobiales bacterium]
MNHLLRDHAPITTAGWEALDEEARAALRPALAARKLVDFSGPHGWEHSATNLGRVAALGAGPVAGVSAAQRRVLPLVELRAEFSLDLAELRDADRGADDLDLANLDEAARKLALAENVAVFHGFAEGGITGITEASPHEAIPLGDGVAQYPGRVAKAVAVLRGAGVDGPYGLALSPEGYTGVVETAEHGGVLLFEHLRAILGGPIVWAPGVRGAVVLSMRGDDFSFESGEDLSLGFAGHDAGAVRLYLEESFSFRVASPEAAVALSAS